MSLPIMLSSASQTLAPILAFLLLASSCLAVSGDLTVVSLFDGERSDRLNTWGGAFSAGSAESVAVQSRNVHSGDRALEIRLGTLEAGDNRFVQCFASGFGPTRDYHQTRDLRRYERLEFWLRNATGALLSGSLQVKDARDSQEHRAEYRYPIPAKADWICIQVPLELDNEGWTVEGEPDLANVLSLDFFFEALAPVHDGAIQFDDLVLVEPGGPADIEHAPMAQLVELLARRQWEGLWSTRSPIHSLIPNNSYQSTDAALNATSAVLWMLPAATRRGWVGRDEADRYVAALLQTLDILLDQAKHVPPRNVDWVTLRPSLLPEESSVDAAFLALALHRYKTLPSTPAELRREIDRVQNRFDFAAFACPAGWRMAYRYASRLAEKGMVSATYDGYTNEGAVVSLASHLSQSHHVPIETFWSTDTCRVRVRQASFDAAPVVHAWKEFRAPFVQALFNLFVDVRQRGVDIYPEEQLAANPWQNFVCYQEHVMASLAESGRPWFVQPDAGDDGTLTNYQQFSIYEPFGQPDLFMPYSAAFPLLAGTDGAEAALRFLLRHGLHGPFGLADSARWETGAPKPSAVTPRHDFWNTALATMAMLEWLDGDQRSSKAFAELPEIKKAMDRVFPVTPKASQPQQAGTPAVMAAG